MIKDTLKFAGKIALVFCVITFFTIMGLTLILGMDINDPLRILAGGVFILFMAGMIWDNCSRWGEKDCRAVINYVRNKGSKEQLKESRAQLYYPAKGFIAGGIVMLIPFIATVVYILMAYRGWENGLGNEADMLYTALYFVFIAFTPVLVLATTVCTTMTAIPGMAPIAALGLKDVVVLGGFDYIGIPNMVLPYMFLIPIVLFVILCGVCYITGFKKRAQEVPKHMQAVYFPKDNKFIPMPNDETVLNGEVVQKGQNEVEP